MFMLFSI